MLKSMDRVVIVAEDAAAAGAGWEHLLDAEPAGSRPRPAIGAQAHCWRIGDGWVEVLTPDGSGVVAAALAARGPHLFAGGFTTEDPRMLAQHLESLGIEPCWDDERLVLDAAHSGIDGLSLVIGPHDPQSAVGLIDTFYELTDLVADADREAARAAEVLGLDAGNFQPITSDNYGYRGALTLFHRDRLDRVEIITPDREGTTMHRFFRRFGAGLYMAFAETGNLIEIERRAQALGAGHTADPPADARDARGPHTVFLHPSALGGMMLGLSRRTYAWTWSGHPERVETLRV